MKKADITDVSGNFLASDRVDNWHSYGYEDHRFLDALARVLMIDSKKNVVSAVCKKDNIFYLSYNKTLKDEDKAELEIICELISEKNYQELVSSYIVNNYVDFVTKVKYFDKKLKFEKSNNALSGFLSHRKIDQDIKSLKDIIEKHIELKQSKEYKLFEKLKKEVKNIQETIRYLSIDNDVDSYLYKLCYKIKNNELDQLWKDLKNDKDLNRVKLFKYYNELLSCLENENDSEFASIILRPLQDISKIFHKNLNLMLSGTDSPGNLKLCDNPRNLHAEHNILDEVKPQESSYIGISRLSCMDCDYLLSDNLLLHRGTHGIYYKNCFEGLLKYINDNERSKISIEDRDELSIQISNLELMKFFSSRYEMFSTKNCNLFDAYKINNIKKYGITNLNEVVDKKISAYNNLPLDLKRLIEKEIKDLKGLKEKGEIQKENKKVIEKLIILDYKQELKRRYDSMQEADLSDDDFESGISFTNVDGLESLSFAEYKQLVIVVTGGSDYEEEAID